MVASSKGDLKLVKLLVEKSADVSDTTNDGNFSIDLARCNHHEDVVTFLESMRSGRRFAGPLGVNVASEEVDSIYMYSETLLFLQESFLVTNHVNIFVFWGLRCLQAKVAKLQ